MSAADEIIDLYERRGDAWVAVRLREAVLYERGWLDRFCALVPAGGAILDLGCGAGESIARHLAECGYRLTGVDSSPAMVAKFQARLPDQEALVGDMRALALGRAFDGVLAWDSFFHLDHAAQAAMFPIFRAHTRPGAPLMFTSGPRHGEAIGELEGEPLYHASLDPAVYRAHLDASGFDVVDTVVEDPTCGRRTIWLARRR